MFKSFIFIFLYSSLSFAADDCILLKKQTRVQNKVNKKIHTIFKGESIPWVESLNGKLDIVSLSGSEYKIYKKNYSKQKKTCSDQIGQCLKAKKNLKLRDSVKKKYKRVGIDSGQQVFISSEISRNGRSYYRLAVGDDIFAWTSDKQINRIFEECSGGDKTSKAADEGSEYVSELEDEMMGGGGVSEQAQEEVDSMVTQSDAGDRPFRSKSYYSVRAGYGLGVSTDFLAPFVTLVADESNVKDDPDPIIQSSSGGTGLSVGLSYKRNIFSKRVLLQLGLAYEQNSFTLNGKSNPATTSSIVRLSDLDDYELEIDLSVVSLMSGLSYRLYGNSILKIMVGLDVGIDYSLNDQIIIEKRIGSAKITAAESTLALETIKGVATPGLELWFDFGLTFGLQYKYVFGSDGYLHGYLGYTL